MSFVGKFQCERKMCWLVFVFFIIYACIARLAGIRYGLPYIYHPDEWVLVKPAIHMLEHRTLNPGLFAFPGSIIIYALSFLYACVTVSYYLFLLLITGQVHSFAEFIELTGKNWNFNPAAFYCTGRVLIGCVSISMLFVMHSFVRKRFGQTPALLSVLCLVCSTLYLKFSHYVRPDAVACFLILISMIFMVKFFEKKRHWHFILACILAGFSVSAKYTSGVVVFPILWAALYLDISQMYSGRSNKPAHKQIFMKSKVLQYLQDSILLRTYIIQACFLIGIAFLVVSPYILLDYETALKDLLYETKGGRIGVSRLPGIQNHLWYLNAIRNGLGGTFFFAVSCLGLFRGCKKRKIGYWIFFSFPVFYFIFIGFGHLRWDRWIFPVLPFMSISFGIGGIYLFCLVKRWCPRCYYTITSVSLLILFVMFIGLAAKTNVHYIQLLCKADTRTQAKNWIEDNLESGSTIVCENNTPQLWVNPEKSYILINRGYKFIISKPLSYYRKNGASYLILSANIYKYYKEDPVKYHLQLDRLKEIERQCDIVKEFSSEDNLGPDIRIYKIRKVD